MLQQFHVHSHTNTLTHLSIICNRQFRPYTQKKRRKNIYKIYTIYIYGFGYYTDLGSSPPQSYIESCHSQRLPPILAVIVSLLLLPLSRTVNIILIGHHIKGFCAICLYGSQLPLPLSLPASYLAVLYWGILVAIVMV